MNLSFADALSRRLGPAWPLAEAFALTGLQPRQPCDAASTSLSIASLEKKLLLLLLRLFRLLSLLRFLRHVALQAMSKWRYRCEHIRSDVHHAAICTAANRKLRIPLRKNEQCK